MGIDNILNSIGNENIPSKKKAPDSIQDARKARNTAESKLLQIAATKATETGDNTIINKTYNLLHQKRQGKQLPKDYIEDEDVLSAADELFAKEGNVHSLKKALNDTSFDPSPAAKEWGTYNAPTKVQKPTQAQGASKQVKTDIASPVPVTNATSPVPAPNSKPTNPIEKASLPSLMDAVKLPDFMNPDNYGKETKTAIPGGGTPMYDTPQMRNAPKEQYKVNRKPSEFNTAPINPNQTYSDRDLEIKIRTEKAAKVDPAWILRQEKAKLRTIKTQAEAYTYLNEKYGSVAGNKAAKEWDKANDITSFTYTPYRPITTIKGKDGKAIDLSANSITGNFKSNNQVASEYAEMNRQYRETVATNLFKINEERGTPTISLAKLPQLDKRVSEPIKQTIGKPTLPKKDKEYLDIKDKLTYEERLIEAGVYNKVIKKSKDGKVYFNDTKTILESIEQAKKIYEDMQNEASFGMAISGEDKYSTGNMLVRASEDINMGHAGNFFNSIFGGDSGKEHAMNHYQYLGAMDDLISIAGYVDKKQNSNNVSVDMYDGNKKDAFDLANMEQLNMGINSVTKSAGIDANPLALYQNLKDVVFGGESWIHLAARIYKEPEKVFWGNGTSDLAAKKLALLMLQKSGQVDIGDGHEMSGEEIYKKLQPILQNKSAMVNVINNLTDTASMFLPIGSWELGAATMDMAMNTKTIAKGLGRFAKGTSKAISKTAKEVGGEFSQAVAKGIEGTVNLSEKGVKKVANVLEDVAEFSGYSKINGLAHEALIAGKLPIENKLAKIEKKLEEAGLFDLPAFKERQKMLQETFGTIPESAIRAARNSFAQQFWNKDPESMQNSIDAAKDMGIMDIMNNVFGRVIAQIAIPTTKLLKSIGRNLSDANAKKIVNNATHIAYQLGGIPAAIAHTIVKGGDYTAYTFLQDVASNAMFMHGNVKDMYKRQERNVFRDISEVYGAYKYNERHEGNEGLISFGDDVAKRVGRTENVTVKDVLNSTNFVDKLGMAKEDRDNLAMIQSHIADRPVEFISFKENVDTVTEQNINSPGVNTKDKIYMNTDVLAGNELNTTQNLFTLLTHEGIHEPINQAIRQDPTFETDLHQAIMPWLEKMGTEEGQMHIEDNIALQDMMDHMWTDDGLDGSEFFAEFLQTDSELRKSIRQFGGDKLVKDIKQFYKDRVIPHVGKEYQDAALESVERVNAMQLSFLKENGTIDDDFVEHSPEINESMNSGKGIDGDSINDVIKFIPAKSGFRNAFDMKDYYLDKPQEEVYADVKAKLINNGADKDAAHKTALLFSHQVERLERMPVVKVVCTNGKFSFIGENKDARLLNGKQIDNLDYKATYFKRACDENKVDMVEGGYYYDKVEEMPTTAHAIVKDLVDNMSRTAIINQAIYEGDANGNNRLIKDTAGSSARTITADNRLRSIRQGVWLSPQDSAKATIFPTVREAFNKIYNNEKDPGKIKQGMEDIHNFAGIIAKSSFFKMAKQTDPNLALFEPHIRFADLVKGEKNFITQKAKDDGFAPTTEQIDALTAFRDLYYKDNDGKKSLVFGDRRKLFTDLTSKDAETVQEAKKSLLELAHGAIDDYNAWTYDPIGVNRMNGGKHQSKYYNVIDTRAMNINSKKHADQILELDPETSEAEYNKRGINVRGDKLTVFNATVPPEVAKYLSPEVAMFFRDPSADGAIYTRNKVFDTLCELRQTDKDKTNFLKLKAADTDLINKAGWHRDNTKFFGETSLRTDGQPGRQVAMFGGASGYKAKKTREANIRKYVDGANHIAFTPEGRIIVDKSSSPEYVEQFCQEMAQILESGQIPDALVFEQDVTGDNGYTFVGQSHEANSNKGFSLGTAGNAQMPFFTSAEGQELIKLHDDLHERVDKFYDRKIKGYEIVDKMLRDLGNTHYTPEDSYNAGIAMSEMANKLKAKYRNPDVPDAIKALYSQEQFDIAVDKCINPDGTVNQAAIAELALLYPSLGAKEKSMTAFGANDQTDFKTKMVTQGFSVTLGAPQNVKDWIVKGFDKFYNPKLYKINNEVAKLKSDLAAFDKDMPFVDFVNQKESFESKQADLDKWKANIRDEWDKENYIAQQNGYDEAYSKFVSDPSYQAKLEWFNEKMAVKAELDQKNNELWDRRKSLETEFAEWQKQVEACIDPRTGLIKPGARLADGSIPVIISQNEIRTLNKHKQAHSVPITPFVRQDNFDDYVKSNYSVIGDHPIEFGGTDKKFKQFARKRNSDVVVNMNDKESLEKILASIDKAASYGNRIHIWNNRRNDQIINYCRNNGYDMTIFGRGNDHNIYKQDDSWDDTGNSITVDPTLEGQDYYVPPTESGYDWYNKSKSEVPEIGVGSKVFGVLTPSAGVESMAPMTIIGVGDVGMMYTDNTYLTKYQGRDFDADKLGIMGPGGVFSPELFQKYYDAILAMTTNHKDNENINVKGINESPNYNIDNPTEIDWDGMAKAYGIPKRKWTSRPQDPDFYKTYSSLTSGIGDTISVRNKAADFLRTLDPSKKNITDFQIGEDGSAITQTINALVQKAVDTYDPFNYDPAEMLKAVLWDSTKGIDLAPKGSDRADSMINAYSKKDSNEVKYNFSKQVPGNKYIYDKESIEARKEAEANDMPYEERTPDISVLQSEMKTRAKDAMYKYAAGNDAYIASMGIEGTVSSAEKLIGARKTASRLTDFALNSVDKAITNTKTQKPNEYTRENVKFLDDKYMELVSFDGNDYQKKLNASNRNFLKIDEQGHSMQTIVFGTTYNTMLKLFTHRDKEFGAKPDDRFIPLDNNESMASGNRYVKQVHDRVDIYQDGQIVEQIPLKEFFHDDGRPNRVPPEFQNSKIWETIVMQKEFPQYGLVELSAGLSSNLAKYMSNNYKKNKIDISPDVLAPSILFGDYSNDPGKNKYVKLAISDTLSQKDDKGEYAKFYSGIMGYPEKFLQYGIEPKFIGKKGGTRTYSDTVKLAAQDAVTSYYGKPENIQELKQQQGKHMDYYAQAIPLTSILKDDNNTIGRYETIDVFKKAIQDDADFKKSDGTQYTLIDITNDAGLYSKFHEKIVAPAINKLVGTRVPNREEVVNDLIDLFSVDNMQDINDFSHRTGVGLAVTKGMALAEMGNMIKKINRAGRYRNYRTDYNYLKSSMPLEIIDRTAQNKKGYNANYVVNKNFKMKDGELIELEDTKVGHIVDAGTHVASPLQYRSPIDVECIRPLTSMRNAIDGAAHVLESLKVSDLDMDGFINSGMEIHVDINSDGSIGNTRYRQGKELDVLNENVTSTMSTRLANTVASMRAIKAAGGSLKIAAAKLDAMQNGADSATLNELRDQSRKLHIIADKMLQGDVDYLKNQSLTSDMSNSQISEKLGEMISGLQQADTKKRANETALKNKLNALIGSRLPISTFTKEGEYTTAVDEATKYLTRANDIEHKMDEQDSTDFASFLTDNIDKYSEIKDSHKAFYTEKATKAISDALSNMRNRYKGFNKELPATLDEFLKKTSDDMHKYSKNAEQFVQIDDSKLESMTRNAQDEIRMIDAQLEGLKTQLDEAEANYHEQGIDDGSLPEIQTQINNLGKEKTRIQSSINNGFKRTYDPTSNRELGSHEASLLGRAMSSDALIQEHQMAADLMENTGLIHNTYTDPNGNEIKLDALSSIFNNPDKKIDFSEAVARRDSIAERIKSEKTLLNKLGVTDLTQIDALLMNPNASIADYIDSLRTEGVDLDTTGIAKRIQRYANAQKSLIQWNSRYGWRKARELAEAGDNNGAYAAYKQWYDYIGRETESIRNMVDKNSEGNLLEDMDPTLSPSIEAITNNMVNSIGEHVGNKGNDLALAYNIMNHLGVPGYEKNFHEHRDQKELDRLSQKAQGWLYRAQERFISDNTQTLKVHDWYSRQGREDFTYQDAGNSTASMPDEMVMQGIIPNMLCKAFDELSGNTDVNYSHSSNGIVKSVKTSLSRIMHSIDGQMIKKMHSFGETSPHAITVGSRAIGRGFKNNLLFNQSGDNMINKNDIMQKLQDNMTYQHCKAGTPVLVQVNNIDEEGTAGGGCTDVIGDVVGYYSRQVLKADPSGGKPTMGERRPTMVIYDPQTHQLHNIDLEQVSTIVQGSYNGHFAKGRFKQAQEAYQKHSETILSALSKDDGVYEYTVKQAMPMVGPQMPTKGEPYRKSAYIDVGTEFRAYDTGTPAREAITGLREDINDITKGASEKLMEAAYISRVAETYGLAGSAVRMVAGAGIWAATGDATMLSNGTAGLLKKVVKNVTQNTLGVAQGIAFRQLGSRKKAMFGSITKPFETFVESYKGRHAAKSDTNTVQNSYTDLVRDKLQSITTEEIAGNSFSREFNRKRKEVRGAQERLQKVMDCYETKIKYAKKEEVNDIVAKILDEHGLDAEGVTIESLGKNDYDISVDGYHYPDIKNFKISFGDQLLNLSTANGLFSQFENISTTATKSVVDHYIKDMQKRIQDFDIAMGEKNLTMDDITYQTLAHQLLYKTIGNYDRTPSQETLLGRNLTLYKGFGKERSLDGTAYLKQRKELYSSMLEFIGKDSQYVDFCKQNGLQGIVIGDNLLYDYKQELANRVLPNTFGALKNGFPKFMLRLPLFSALSQFFFRENKWWDATLGGVFEPIMTWGDMAATLFKDSVNFMMIDHPGTKIGNKRIGPKEYEKVQTRITEMPGKVSKQAFGLGMGETNLIDMTALSAMAFYNIYREQKFDIGKTTKNKKTANDNAFFINFAKTTGTQIATMLPLVGTIGGITSELYNIETANKPKKKD